MYQVFKEANSQFEGLVSQTDVRALVGTKAAGGAGHARRREGGFPQVEWWSASEA